MYACSPTECAPRLPWKLTAWYAQAEPSRSHPPRTPEPLPMPDRSSLASRVCPRAAAFAAALLTLALSSACEDKRAEKPPLPHGLVGLATHTDELRPPVDNTADTFLGQLNAAYSSPNLIDG